MDFFDTKEQSTPETDEDPLSRLGFFPHVNKNSLPDDFSQFRFYLLILPPSQRRDHFFPSVSKVFLLLW